ncbi:MAG TPA: PadR family transcriptional regulator [Solirubrobacteraceae bacterium]|nr:PadR family transcriptional regulator [Solirubrobacteraceae bacterium]
METVVASEEQRTRVGVVSGHAVKSMRSPVNWSLLGLVIQRPSYGYELVQRFERAYGEALELSSPSQIYTALDTLQRRGLIELLPVSEPPEPSRQPKPHYRVTAEGMVAYVDWLACHVHGEQRRSRLFVHQLAVLATPEALAVIERCEHACLKAATAKPPPSESVGGALADRLLDEEQRLLIDARLSWFEYARRQLCARDTATATRT